MTSGEKATIRLHDAKARVILSDGDETEMSFPTLARTDHAWEAFGSTRRGVVASQRINLREPLLNIVPKESTQIANYCRVPAHSPCRVEVTVIGMRRSGLQMGQWRASCVSPPRDALMAEATQRSRRGLANDVLSWLASLRG
jgi:hypothetical protein